MILSRPEKPCLAAEPATQASGIRLEAVEPGQPLEVKVISDTHLSLRFPADGKRAGLYVLAKISGVEGKTVQIDFDGPPFDKWATAVPQYGYVTDLANPAAWNFGEPDLAHASAPMDNEAIVALTAPNASWQYMEKALRDESGVSYEQSFTQDTAYIAFRVPHTVDFDNAYLQTLAKSPVAKVEQVGTSTDGKPLNVVTIADPAPVNTHKPCVVIYAREHADEQDSTWLAQGAIEFLVSDTDAAKATRAACDFIIIPIIDPKAAAVGAHESFVFYAPRGEPCREALAYATWFKARADADGRIDAVLNLHNPPPSSAFHVACPMMSAPGERATAQEALHAVIRTKLLGEHFMVRNTPWYRSEAIAQFGGWLQDAYGTIHLPYEVNSLAPKRHLNLAELKVLGAMMAQASAEFWMTDAGKAALEKIDAIRAQRQRAIEHLGAGRTQLGASVIETERMLGLSRPATQPTTRP
ncbi:MAG: M14 family zinc carboxypeptidase [Tepidisphaeraceae bacterium]